MSHTELARAQGPMRDGVYWWDIDHLVALIRDDAAKRWFVVSCDSPDAEIAFAAMPMLRRANVGTSLHIAASTLAHIVRETDDERLRVHARQELRQALEAAT